MTLIKLQARVAGRLSGFLCALLMLCLASAALAAQAVLVPLRRRGTFCFTLPVLGRYLLH